MRLQALPGAGLEGRGALCVIKNSFDAIDLTTFYESSYYVLLDETRAFLKDNGLLSEEVAQVIFNNISNNNSQNISISRSRNVSLGRISHQASATKA